MEWYKEEFVVSDDKNRINLKDVSELLSTTYWASNRDLETIEKSVNNSLSFGVYHKGIQVGFARVVTDKTFFSWILDVVINDHYKGRGLGRWLMECIFEHPDIKFTAFALATSDAHEFYKKFDFKDNACMTKPILSE